MSFLNNLVNEFTHQGQGQGQSHGQGRNESESFYEQQSYSSNQQGGYPRPQGGYNNQPYNNERPNPPEPWTVEWDYQASTWVFINRNNGHRQHEFPRMGGGGYQDSYTQSTTYTETDRYGGRPPQQQPSHSGRNTAIGVAAGLAGGALLMHEGHKVEERWDEDKERFDYDRDRVEDRYDYDRDRVEDRFDYDRDRVEDRVRYDEDRVEDFTDDAARWTGRKVQEVEDIPEDVAGWTGRKVQEVEDIPEDVAGWTGRKVERVEDYGDDIRDSYDDGRVEQSFSDDRYDDVRYNDNY